MTERERERESGGAGYVKEKERDAARGSRILEYVDCCKSLFGQRIIVQRLCALLPSRAPQWHACKIHNCCDSLASNHIAIVPSCFGTHHSL